MRKDLPFEQQVLLQLEEYKILAAQPIVRTLCRGERLPSLQDAEFKVFSQWGDDGIIQYLVSLLDVTPHTFIEFGVEDYQESNTRFLLFNNGWSGLILDADPANIETITHSEYYWRYDLSAHCAFVTRESINCLLERYGYAGPLGILSIDIDGNDYWVWEAITVTQPVVVIIEYNSLFGAEHAVTIPYDPAFSRRAAHYSTLYFGASLKALSLLAERKGYSLVGCNSAGCNAYFVRNDRLGLLPPLTVAEAYVRSSFRESQRPNGGNSYVSGDARLQLIRDCLIEDVERQEVTTIGDRFAL